MSEQDEAARDAAIEAAWIKWMKADRFPLVLASMNSPQASPSVDFMAGFDAGAAHARAAAVDGFKQAVIAEPELPEAMPDEMWEAIQGLVATKDKEEMQEILRITVRLTKSIIINSMEAVAAEMKEAKGDEQTNEN